MHFLKTHKKLLIPPVIVVVVLSVTFWPRPAAPIDTAVIKQTNITQSISATGTIDSEKSVDLNFLAAGKLVYLGVKKGDLVKQWQVIATLDQRTMQKNLETALRNYSLQRNEFDQTKSDNANHTPQDALTDNLKRILQNNQYDLDKAVISVELGQLAREQSVLASPISGIVTRADAKTAGVNVTAATTFTVADPTSLVFKIDVDEADIGKVQEGKSLKVTLDAYPDIALDLSVNSIDFTTHATTGGGSAFTVQAAMPPNSDFTYRVGMSGDAEIILDEKDNVLTVPLASIAQDKYVYVQTEKSFEKREIKLGLKNDTDAEVLDGLHAGDKVAIDPTEAEKMMNKKRFIFF